MGAPRGASAKGGRRRVQIVRAAAALALEEGPEAVTHRAVARRAQVPLAATTYYFAGLDDLLSEAGALIASTWALSVERVSLRRGDAVRDAGSEGLIDAVLDAMLARSSHRVRGQYEHLVGAGRSPALARSYARGRARIDAAVGALLDAAGVQVAPSLVVAVVDGAAVTALSEGRSVRGVARELLRQVL